MLAFPGARMGMTADMDSGLQQLVDEAQSLFASCETGAELENAKAKFLGKSGQITALMKELGKLPVAEKKQRGAAINSAKNRIQTLLDESRAALAEAELQKQLEAEALDVTLPGRQRQPGGLHPVSLAWERIEAIFAGMGFDVADGPEVEEDWFSFTALNNPPNHPARSMQDTFYVDMKGSDGISLNLRPHTSPMQIRYAQAYNRQREAAGQAEAAVDVRVIAPGRTYRVDSDATHSPMFHQFEGLWLGSNVSFRDLKAVYLGFCRAFFETDELTLRFRPSYFPFTEPSAEIDIQFHSGALAGKWLEVAGSGQVHPQVVRNMGFDPENVMGFAFGSGIDRLAMLRYGVSDLRLFFENDLRFLQQFA